MTDSSKLDYLLRLPWTFVREVTPDGDCILRIAEIPSAVGTGDTDAALEADTWASLRASLEAYLHFGDPLPLPKGTVLPWDPDAPRREGPSTVILRRQLRLTYPTETAGTASPIASY